MIVLLTEFFHLRAHTYYSFLEGLSSPRALVEKAHQNGMSALGLTDHYRLTGAIEFYLACLERQIKPVIGLELPVQHPFGIGELALFAMDITGWGNLCKLCSLLHDPLSHDYSRGISWIELSQYNQGIICTSGGRMGLTWELLTQQRFSDLQRVFSELREIFPERFFVELQIHDVADQKKVRELYSLAKELNLPSVATHSIFYVDELQTEFQRTCAAIRLNQNRDNLPAHSTAPARSYFLTREEIMESFKEYPEAITITQEIVDRCRLELPLDRPNYPTITLPKGRTAIEELRQKSYEGAKKRYINITPEIRKRLDHELSTIDERDYAPLFLIVKEVMDFARDNSIPVSSRGSAASSLVAHCLGITSPDPLGLNLYFERFLNPARSTPPDIDIDISSNQRDKIIRYVYKKFGADRVAMVATINRFRRRSALRETAKAFGVSQGEIKKLIGQLPWRRWGPPSQEVPEVSDPYTELRTQYTTTFYKTIFDHAVNLLGMPRHLSIHPGGIIISRNPIHDLAPTQLASKHVLITQFDLGSIERLGFLKIDLLGIRGLSVLGDVSEKIYSWHRKEFADKLSVLESIPANDPPTEELVGKAQTIGCFQIESPGMRLTLREINAKTQDDIMTALALYRPGPLTGGLKDAFVRRHLGQERVEHLHFSLEGLLSDTYGVILYQEQVLRIASELAGLSLSDADLLRRAMSHFDPGDRMKTLKEHFILGAYKKNNVPPDRGEMIWNLMAAFAGYGFPKAHAASYAQVAWRSAWCKSNYPAEFMAAVLANWGGYYPQRIYINEGRRMDLDIRPPHINFSGRNYQIVYPDGLPVIYLGLDQIRSLKRKTQDRILSGRPFENLSDFLTRVDPHPTEAENLIIVGALDGMGTIPENLNIIKMRGWSYQQPTLFDLHTPMSNVGDWEIAQRLKAQQSVLGLGIDAHPLELLDPSLFENLTIVSSEDIIDLIGEEIKILGIRQSLQRILGSLNDTVYALEIEDLNGVVTVLLTKDIYLQNRKIIRSRDPIIIEGKIVYEPKLAEAVMIARNIQPVPSS